jgi:hypothetical protein
MLDSRGFCIPALSIACAARAVRALAHYVIPENTRGYRDNGGPL